MTDSKRKNPLAPIGDAEEQPNISRMLGGAAADHGHAALIAYKAGRVEGFYVEAGLALELAMKARLAEVSPFLLAPGEAKWFSHGVRFAKGETIGDGLRSVGGGEALERLEALEPELIVPIKKQVQATIRRRNQSVHMGVFSPPHENEVLRHASAFVQALEGLMPLPGEQLWKELSDLARALVADARNVVRVRVERKLADARHFFQNLSEEQRAALEEVGIDYVNSRQSSELSLVLVTCPACANEAVGDGEIIEDGEPEWDHRDPSPVGWSYAFYTVLTYLECKVCRLELDGADEILAGGLDPRVENENVQPEDFFEPDWSRD